MKKLTTTIFLVLVCLVGITAAPSNAEEAPSNAGDDVPCVHGEAPPLPGTPPCEQPELPDCAVDDTCVVSVYCPSGNEHGDCVVQVISCTSPDANIEELCSTNDDPTLENDTFEIECVPSEAPPVPGVEPCEEPPDAEAPAATNVAQEVAVPATPQPAMPSFTG